MGEDLVTAIVALRQWGDRWLFAPHPHPADMHDAIDGSKIAKLEARGANGHQNGAPRRLRQRAGGVGWTAKRPLSRRQFEQATGRNHHAPRRGGAIA